MNIDRSDLLFPREWSIAQPLRLRERLHQFSVGLTLAERRFLLGALDLLLLNITLIVALFIWSDFPLAAAALAANFKWFLTLSAVWLIVGVALDIYNPTRAASVTQNLLYVGLAALLTGLFYLAIPWLTPPVGRRLLAFGFILLAVGSLTAWRVLYARLFFQPAFRHRVLVVQGETANPILLNELRAAAFTERANPFRGTGYEVVGLVENGDTRPGQTRQGIPLLTAGNLVHEARHLAVDEIIVADSQALPLTLREALLDCWELGLQVAPLSAAYERLTARVAVEFAAQDLCLVAGASGGAADSPGQRLFRAAKRLADILLSLVGIGLMIALCPLVALGNALTSPGPLFYRQHRVGRGGRPFVLVKFRTMSPDAENGAGAVWAEADDPRVSPLGRWLRRTRLDELPQFINVLRGEMSVVGPRPERPQFVGELVHHLPLYRARHAMRPGITGWAQVRYRYGNSIESARIKLEYDLYYIKHAGFFLDLLIFLQTIPVMLRFKGY
ncbi:MAG: sugar transferase [Anaerolineae bacterium]|nr:sugar transferase [Anaerolineae bacterium]